MSQGAYTYIPEDLKPKIPPLYATEHEENPTL